MNKTPVFCPTAWVAGSVLRAGLIMLALALALPGAVAQSDSAIEKPPVLRASQILPAAMLKGPNYRIQERVLNDGINNAYNLDTNYGPLRLESTELLRIRVQELKALQRMDQMKRSDTFTDSQVNEMPGRHSAKPAINRSYTAPVVHAKHLNSNGYPGSEPQDLSAASQ